MVSPRHELSPTCYADGCDAPRLRYGAYCRACTGLPDEQLPRCHEPIRCYCPRHPSQRRPPYIKGVPTYVRDALVSALQNRSTSNV